ncbi:MAG: hypothetical protein AAGA02_08210 [Bacteroidota bacterium]
MPEAFKDIAIIDKSNSERLQDFEDGRKQHESDHSIDLEKEKFRQKLKNMLGPKAVTEIGDVD